MLASALLPVVCIATVRAAPVAGLEYPYQSDTVCSDDSQLACGYVGSDSELTANRPTDFVFVISTPGAETVDSVALYLWNEDKQLELNPSRIERIAPGVFQVSGVEFPVSGNWEVRVEFDYLFFQQILIPVVVK